MTNWALQNLYSTAIMVHITHHCSNVTTDPRQALTLVHCNIDSGHTGQLPMVRDLELKCVHSGWWSMDTEASHHGNWLVGILNHNIVWATAWTTRTTVVLQVPNSWALVPAHSVHGTWQGYTVTSEWLVGLVCFAPWKTPLIVLYLVVICAVSSV